MAHKSQGSELYVLDTTVSPVAVLKISGITNISGIGGTAGKIDTTTLDDLRYKRSMSGLIDSGAASIGVLFDFTNDGQDFLHNNAGGENFQFAVGEALGHGTPPTVNGSDDGFELDSSRSWLTFEASVSANSIDIAMDDVWKASSALQVSGEIVKTPAST